MWTWWEHHHSPQHVPAVSQALLPRWFSPASGTFITGVEPGTIRLFLAWIYWWHSESTSAFFSLGWDNERSTHWQHCNHRHKSEHWALTVVIGHPKYMVQQKQVYSCKYVEHNLFLYYYLLIIVFSLWITTVNLLVPTTVYPMEYYSVMKKIMKSCHLWQNG